MRENDASKSSQLQFTFLRFVELPVVRFPVELFRLLQVLQLFQFPFIELVPLIELRFILFPVLFRLRTFQGAKPALLHKQDGHAGLSGFEKRVPGAFQQGTGSGCATTSPAD